MSLQSLHTHSLYDDGSETLMTMAQAAADMGLCAIGFSGHSPIEGSDWCIQNKSLSLYIREALAVEEAFKGKLEVYIGMEQDLISPPPSRSFDYIIGSVHHVPTYAGYISVDESPNISKDAIERYFDGDGIDFAKAYYSEMKELANMDFCDIIGHFDLVTKFNEHKTMIDENSPQYKAVALEALHALSQRNKIFEINTGAMSRGWRSAPYPSLPLLEELYAMGGKITITADAHNSKHIIFGYDMAYDIAKKAGFKEIWILGENGFYPHAI